MTDQANLSQDQAELIAGLKRPTLIAAREVAVEVAGLDGISLVPVGPWILAEQDLIEAMAHWRALAREMFFAQFPESWRGMRDYLQRVSLGRSDSILFHIQDSQATTLGHLGLTHVTVRSAEFDSVMRNPEASPRARFMQSAVEALASWATDNLGIEQFRLKVVSHNKSAIALYERCGFTCTERRPLRRVIDGTVILHEECDIESSNVDFECLIMTRPESRCH